MAEAVGRVDELIAGVHRIELGFVNAYLVEEADGLVLIDAGFPPDAEMILAAVDGLGFDRAAVRDIVITHAHIDHHGAAADVVAVTGARVSMSAIDAPLAREGISGHGPLHILPGMEELVSGQLADPEFLAKTNGRPMVTPMRVAPLAVDEELRADEAVPALRGSTAFAAPGHEAGQLAILLERGGGLLLTGDGAVNFEQPAISPIGEDFDLARDTFGRLSALDFEVACFGHGEPIVGGASAAFRAAL